MATKQAKQAILEELARLYPDARPELHFSNPYETVIATLLSAQTTDKQVNAVTPALFARYPNVEALAAAKVADVEQIIRTVGFFHTKARNAVAAAMMICQEYGGHVPDTMEELTKLPGVGRKTANVVMANAFGKDAIAVDTHVFRVSNRLGLVKCETVEKTEIQLQKAIPKNLWSIAHHWLIFHGRRVCKARVPLCDACTLQEYCDYFKKK